MTINEQLYVSVFFVLYFFVPAMLVWASYSERKIASGVDISALWTHNNRPDKFAVIILGTWWIHSCTIILWTLKGTISTTDYATYMGWAIPIIAKMFAPQTEPVAPKP